MSSVASLAAEYFSTLHHKRYDIRKKMLMNIKYVFGDSLQTLSEIFLVVRRMSQI
jgi:hypothetical protein